MHGITTEIDYYILNLLQEKQRDLSGMISIRWVRLAEALVDFPHGFSIFHLNFIFSFYVDLNNVFP